VVLLWLLLRFGRRRQSITQERAEAIEADGPYAASKDRPYMKAAAETEIDVAQPAVPLPGDLAGIAFPPGSTDHRDDLTRMKGVGPKMAALLNEQGISRYEQLASLGDEEAVALDARMGTFKGRLARDRVVEQARLLASGDRDAYEAQFGKLGG
jgi:predicted flap endonuclease-1-like 5' DNA nuclease